MAITAYLHTHTAPRNAMEQYTIGFCKERFIKLSHGAAPATIEECRAEVVAHVERLRNEILFGRFRQGKIRITEIYVSATYASSGDTAVKAFDIYGPGRKTQSIHISQSIPSQRATN